MLRLRFAGHDRRALGLNTIENYSFRLMNRVEGLKKKMKIIAFFTRPVSSAKKFFVSFFYTSNDYCNFYNL